MNPPPLPPRNSDPFKPPPLWPFLLLLSVVAGLLSLDPWSLVAQQPQAPTPADMTNQIEKALDDARKLNDQLRTMLQPCTYSVAPLTPAATPADGGTVAVTVTTTGSSCAWTAATTDPWLTLSATGGTDTGTLSVLVATNPAQTSRAGSVAIAGATVAIPQDGQPPPPTPPIITDAAGLTAAINAKQAQIVVQGTLTGNFTVPRGSGPMTILGRADLTGRVSPADVNGAVLTCADPLKPALTILSDDVTIRGLTLTGAAKDRTVLVVGSNTATDPATLPHRVMLDQLAVLGVNGFGHRGVELQALDVKLTRSHIAGFREDGRDSQGVYSSNGPGPFLIEDNYIEASAENVLFGGDDPRIQNLVMSDITIRGNTLYKLPAWKGTGAQVKNLLELKNARRVLIEGNVLDGNWRAAQDGSSILFTPRNQYGKAPWVQVADVILRKNVLRNAREGFAVNILGTDDANPSQHTTNITIEGNLFEDAPNGIRVIEGVKGTLVVQNNTSPAIKNNWLSFSGSTTVKTALSAVKNVTLSGQYGVSGDGVSPGMPALQKYVTNPAALTGNVIEKTQVRPITWPAGNTLLNPGGLAPLLDPTYHYTPDPSLGW